MDWFSRSAKRIKREIYSIKLWYKNGHAVTSTQLGCWLAAEHVALVTYIQTQILAITISCIYRQLYLHAPTFSSPPSHTILPFFSFFSRLPSGYPPSTPPSLPPPPLTLQHVSVGIVWDGEDVRWHFCPPLSTVHLDHLLRVDGQHPVGVDCHTEQPRVGLEERRERKRGGEREWEGWGKGKGEGEGEEERESEKGGENGRERERAEKERGKRGRKRGRKRRKGRGGWGCETEDKDEGRMKVCVCVCVCVCVQVCVCGGKNLWLEPNPLPVRWAFSNNTKQILSQNCTRDNGHTTPSTITDDMDNGEDHVTLMEVTYLPCVLYLTRFTLQWRHQDISFS